MSSCSSFFFLWSSFRGECLGTLNFWWSSLVEYWNLNMFMDRDLIGVLLLMEGILHHLGCSGINYLSTGAGFLPSTVRLQVWFAPLWRAAPWSWGQSRVEASEDCGGVPILSQLEHLETPTSVLAHTVHVFLDVCQVVVQEHDEEAERKQQWSLHVITLLHLYPILNRHGKFFSTSKTLMLTLCGPVSMKLTAWMFTRVQCRQHRLLNLDVLLVDHNTPCSASFFDPSSNVWQCGLISSPSKFVNWHLQGALSQGQS